MRATRPLCLRGLGLGGPASSTLWAFRPHMCCFMLTSSHPSSRRAEGQRASQRDLSLVLKQTPSCKYLWTSPLSPPVSPCLELGLTAHTSHSKRGWGSFMAYIWGLRSHLGIRFSPGTVWREGAHGGCTGLMGPEGRLACCLIASFHPLVEEICDAKRAS